MSEREEDLTELLNRPVADGGGLDALMPLVHERLKGLARHQIGKQAEQPTLTPTVLVNEAYLRLAPDEQKRWADRQHFFATAATVLRRIIIDYLRQSNTAKRGGDRQRLELDEVAIQGLEQLSNASGEELIQLDELLERLARSDPRAARVVECHVFGGYTFDEVAETLKISTATAKRDWQFARAWLKREMRR